MSTINNKEKIQRKKNIKASIALAGRSRNIFSNLLRSAAVSPVILSGVAFTLLELPRTIRVRIWRMLGFSHTKTLRLVCSLIKEDIDKFAGISSAIDSTYDDFPFHCSIAIRKVAIHELIIPNYIEFLKYPLVLQELEIRGEITLKTFQYILRSCPNISRLFISFNKFVLDYRTPFFPLPKLSMNPLNPQPLSKLRSLGLVATTKTPSEMLYVYRTLISLLRDSLPNAKIDTLHVWVAHKSSNEYFKEIVWTALVFVHKHASTLSYLSLTFKDRDVNAAAGETPKKSTETEKAGASGNIESRDSSENVDVAKVEQRGSIDSTGSRDISSIPLPPGVVITHHIKDIHSEDASATANVINSPEGEGEANVEVSKSEDSNDEMNIGIAEATRYLRNKPWPKAANLEQISLTMSVKYMEELLHIVSPKTKLQAVQLETIDGGLQSNWDVYKQFIERGNARTLTMVILLGVIHVDSQGKSLPLDLGTFRKSKELRKLSISCHKRDDLNKLSRVKGVSQLPESLNEVNFDRMLLTPWQIIRLILCFGAMCSVSVAYWSISDCQFSILIAVLKWCINLGLTDVNKICIVDTKIRFKNKRYAVRKLQRAVSISVKYQDFDETRLIIDASQRQDEKSFAPRISIHTVASKKPQKLRRSRRKN